MALRSRLENTLGTCSNIKKYIKMFPIVLFQNDSSENPTSEKLRITLYWLKRGITNKGICLRHNIAYLWVGHLPIRIGRTQPT